jgi:hypothetical protein
VMGVKTVVRAVIFLPVVDFLPDERRSWRLRIARGGGPAVQLRYYAPFVGYCVHKIREPGCWCVRVTPNRASVDGDDERRRGQ